MSFTQYLTMSMGDPGGGSSPPPPPPPGYTTGAVAFDGATLLTNAALACTDNGLMLWSMWWFVASNPTAYTPIWAADPANWGVVFAAIREQPAFSTGALVEFGSTAEADCVKISSSNPLVGPDPLGTAGTWHNWLFYSDCTGTPVGALYLDDVSVGEYSTSADGPAPMNGGPFYVGGDNSDSYTGYLADCWVGAGQLLDLSVTANRRKFISASGKPVDLGADGSTPTGTAPAIFLSIPNGGTPANFANNLGTGGSFAITGALTLAPSSPSD